MTSKLTIEQTQQIIDAADAVITALAGTNDEVHKDDTDKMVRLWDDLNDRYAPPEVVRELARMALAAMDSEPVAYADPQSFDNFKSNGGENAACTKEWMWRDHSAGLIPLYRHAQPAPERDQVRREHAEWSQATFGNVGPIGPLKHLRKEALEAIAQPQDLIEWADMQFLLWDAQRRAGITDEQITHAMIEKLAVNKLREWPAPKDGEPRLHIKEQPAPVVPDERAAFNAWNNEDNLPIAGVSAKNAAWLAWQARADLAGNSPVWIGVDWAKGCEPGNSPAHSDRFPEQSSGSPAQSSGSPAQSPIDHGYRPECECSGCQATARICAELAGNSPVIPDGYVMVPMRLTAENGAKGALSGEFSETKFLNCPECFGDVECETCDGSGRIEITAPVTWTTIKEIWAKGVKHFAAAPQSQNEPQNIPEIIPQWIPVSERLPEKNGTYQVWNGKHVGAVPFLFGSFQCLNPEQVTHWMPTAKPPREVNNG